MPGFLGNNKGQPGTGIDYTDFGDFYDCTGTAGLIGENGNNFVEQGAVGSITPGKFDDARGVCDGQFGGGGRGFSRNPSISGTYDTRVSSGFTALTVLGWVFPTSANAANEFFSLARAAAANNTKQFVLRNLQQLDGVPNETPVLLIWDHTSNSFAVAFGNRGVSGGSMPLNEWQLLGCAVDLNANGGDGEARLFWASPTDGTFYSTASLAGVDAFTATALDVAMFGIGSGHSSGGTFGNIDHCLWYNGRAFEEVDFLNHWAGGNGLERSQFILPGGGIVHNAHGVGGNNHGQGGLH